MTHLFVLMLLKAFQKHYIDFVTHNQTFIDWTEVAF